MGSWSSLPLHKKHEAPFWTGTLSEAADVEVQLTTFDLMGVEGAEVFRVLDQGVFDVGLTVADHTVGDAPELEGLDLPLVATDAETARDGRGRAPLGRRDHARPLRGGAAGDRPYPPQIVFCNAPIAGLADLEGLQVRGSGRMTTKLLEALGAESVNLAFSEVPGALERGVIDCAVTGSGSGYSAGWHEVSTHLLPLPLGGWDPVVTAMNLERWEGLPALTWEAIRSAVASEFEAPAWDVAAGSLATDIACLTGGDCPLGEAASMTLVKATAEDEATVREALTDTVLPDWAERAGGDWAER